MIEVCTFVCELCCIRKYNKSVCKILWDEELFLILSRQNNTVPLSVSLRTFSQVNGNIKYFSAYNTYKFVLRIVDLEMKSAENALAGA